jgi:hypothetical protein
MLRSLASILLGGCLCLLMNCAGTIVLPSIYSHAQSQLERRPSQPSLAGRSPAEVEDAGHVISSVALEPVPPVVELIASFIAGIFGGYFAAWLAGRAEVLHGLLAAWPMLLFALLLLAISRGVEPLSVVSIATALLGVVFSGIGGGLRHWQRYAGQV